MKSRAAQSLQVGFCLIAAFSLAAEANGYRILGVRSARATALGEAVVAWPDEPAAVVFNPAGLTDLDGTMVNAHATTCRGYIRHTATDGVESRNEDGWQTVPSVFMASDLGTDWLALGFGASMPNGLSSEWGEDSFARYVATYSELSVADIGPALGVRLGDRVSVGAGLSYFRSKARLDAMVDGGAILASYGVPGAAPGMADMGRSLEGDGDGWGGRFGAIVAPMDGHRFGIAYHLPFSIAYDGDLSVDGVPGTPIVAQRTPIETQIDFPAVLTAGYAVEPTKKLRLEVDLDWTLWNSVDDIVIRTRKGAVFMDGSTQQPPMRQGLENTLTWKLGAQYMHTDRLALRAGYIYNQNATRESTWRPSLPDTDTHFFMLGGGYVIGCLTVDLALQVVHYEKRSIDNNVDNNELSSSSSVDGTYRNWAPCVSLGLTYNF